MNSQNRSLEPPNEYHRESFARTIVYANKHNLSIEERLGWGIQGIVHSSTIRTAIKCHLRREGYEVERNAYLRLKQHRVTSVAGFWVPSLVRHDDELYVIEMRVVQRPFVLDFAGTYLDRPLPFDEDQLTEWQNDKMAQFGDRWPLVRQVIFGFKKYGIHLSDLKPGNIEFASDSTAP